MPFDDVTETFIRRPSASWIGGYLAGSFIGLMAAGFGAFGLALAVSSGWRIGSFLLVLAFWMGYLAHYCWRDAAAKRGWKIGLGYDALSLHLPAGRSLMAASEPVHRTLLYADIRAVETRLESYRTFGMSTMQRAYAFRLSDNSTIRLGEDRALGTNLSDPTISNLVDRIIQRARLPLHDLGMVDGAGGFLGVAFTAIPSWDAADVGAARAAANWRVAEMTGWIAGLASLVVLAAAILI